MSDTRLEHEARIFTRALIGAAATPPVVRGYIRGHVSLPLAPVQGFDAVLMAVARAGPFLARAADAYARRFAPRAILRRKLTLLLAILESVAPFDAAFAPVAATAPGTIVRLAFAGAAAVIFTVLGILIVGPLHFVSRLAAGRT